MIVLIADSFERSGLEALERSKFEVHYRPELSADDLGEALESSQAQCLIVRSTRVTSAALERAPRLALVVRAGAGVNTIDVAAASARGVFVANCPGKNADAVAELTFGLLLALDRRIPDAVADLRAGVWKKGEYSKANGLAGRTLGVLGLGSIGIEVVRRAIAFRMPVVAWSRRFQGSDRPLAVHELEELGLSELGGREVSVRLAPDPVAVAARASALSVHVALGPETRKLVGQDVFEALPAGALFVNTSRAEVVDEEALRRAVMERGIRAGLDVFAQEPTGATGAFADPIVALPGVYGTHHVGASTEQAQEAIAAETVRILDSFRTTGRAPNCVNLTRRAPAQHRLVVRHKNRPGVLAHVFDRLREAGINVHETENIVFDGAEAALATIDLATTPSPETLSSMISGHEAILEIRSLPIG